MSKDFSVNHRALIEGLNCRRGKQRWRCEWGKRWGSDMSFFTPGLTVATLHFSSATSQDGQVGRIMVMVRYCDPHANLHTNRYWHLHFMQLVWCHTACYFQWENTGRFAKTPHKTFKNHIFHIWPAILCNAQTFSSLSYTSVSHPRSCVTEGRLADRYCLKISAFVLSRTGAQHRRVSW